MKKSLTIYLLILLNISFAANPKVRMVTSFGEVDIELFEKRHL